MNILLTYDYELFFGKSTGSVDKCLIEPTNELIAFTKKFNIQITFFVDVGYLIRLEYYSQRFQHLKEDYQKILQQLNDILDSGNDIQLHIHPHWEQSVYRNNQWEVRTNGAYKLDDFSDEEIRLIVSKYKHYLDAIVGYKTTVFRAGGWCIQPFHRLKTIFKELGITIDSSVFPGGSFYSSHYHFDFTKSPKKEMYRFEDNESEEVDDGYFTEYPIGSIRYYPLFYWKLYTLGRLFPSQHKMIGDGVFLRQPNRKTSSLIESTWNHISTDGFYASKLEYALRHFKRKKFSTLVFIGHPKGMTRYSLRKTETFIQKYHKEHSFISFRQLP
jgi:hypothetical protein